MSDCYIGLMSGTSLDGVDGVLVDFAATTPRVRAYTGLPLPSDLRAALLQLNHSGPDELHRSATAALELAELYRQVVRALLQQAALPASAIRAIGAHGQTVRHCPGGHRAYTLQINQPAWLAEHTGIAVVADFRSRDVAAGGQGAPLVPAFHRQVFAQPGHSVAVVNIGGIANITALPAHGPVQGLDTGPGNALLDEWCQHHTGQPYDDHGHWAATGQVHPGLLATLLDAPYFHAQGNKSTGRDLFHLGWLHTQLQPWPDLAPQDVQATLVQLTARSIALGWRSLDWGQHPPGAGLVCGGGAHNTTLMQALQDALPDCPIRTTTSRGWPVMQVEAAAFAWLARQCVQGQPGNEPAVTGARGARVLGAIYPA